MEVHDVSSAVNVVAMEEKVCVDNETRCSECGMIDSTTRGDQLRVCVGCKLTVHDKCYAEALPDAKEETENSETTKKDEAVETSEWKCDCCRRGVQRQMVKCVYCGQTGDSAALKVVETGSDAAFWRQFAGLKDAIESKTESAVQWGHVLCINWDPRRLAAQTVRESRINFVDKVSKKECTKEAAKDIAEEADTEAANEETEKTDKLVMEEGEEAVPDANEVLMKNLLPPGKCCFCHSSEGVRIQCRRVKCARDFHAMCAHQGTGHVELRTDHLVQFHAYCDRHGESTEDIGDLLAKLITRPIRLLIGRDDMRRFGTVAKRLPDYVSAGVVLRDLAALIIGYCNKGLRASKNEPPDYNVKHLQVLQFFLSHVPQLEKVYALPSIPARDFINDSKLFRHLERTFDPPGYVAKYPGPFSQVYTCDVCFDPFHERQHLFYCAGEDKSAVPHVQHWRCTKRRSHTRDRERYLSSTSAKKPRKVIAIVQDGVRKDIMLPKGLTSLTDDVMCGVCRAPVDARGLVASHKEAKSMEFEKKASKFVQNGCFINHFGAKGCSYGPNASFRKSARPADGKSNGSSTGQQVVAQPMLGPPKMDRINVQRTTRWLACVAQIIRLVGTSASTASADVSKSTNDVTPSAITAASVVDGATDSAGIKPSPDILSHDSSTTALAHEASKTKAEDGRSLALDSTTVAKTSSTAPLPASIAKETPSLVTPAVQALFNEVMRLVRPYDSYALSKLETAYDMLLHRSGPGVAVLRMFTHEYTRFVYIKHTRAVEKARNEKRKRAEYEAQENREKERKRMNLEAERALKKQMLAMRNKQRQHLKASSK